MTGVKVVKLSPSDVERARRIADTRNSKNGKVPNYKITRKHSDWDIHFAGAKSEIAVCKYYNFPVDEHFSMDGDNGDPDLYIGDYSAQVKSPVNYPPILKLNKLSEFITDIAVLCYSGNDEVEIHGVVSKAKFLKNNYQRDFGYGVRYCMDANSLTGLDDFDKITSQAQRTP